MSHAAFWRVVAWWSEPILNAIRFFLSVSNFQGGPYSLSPASGDFTSKQILPFGFARRVAVTKVGITRLNCKRVTLYNKGMKAISHILIRA